MKIRILHGDLVVWAVFFFLCAISLIEVFSAGSFLALKEGSFISPLLQQGTFLSISGLAAYFLHNIPCRFFKLFPILGIPVVLFFLIWAMAAGQNLNSGARWISLMGISFQPSELAKLVLVLTVALILSTHQRDTGASPKVIRPILGITFIICGLIFTQNFSTAALLFTVVVLMMFIGRVPLRQLGILIGSLAALALLGLVTLRTLPADPRHSLYDNLLMQRVPTWRARLFNETMIITSDPRDFVVTDKNRQVVNAHIAIARAHGTGVAPGRSIQRDYLSAAYSDFIFAIIGEEMGLIGCSFVVLLYLVLLIRAGRIASRCKSNFPAFLVMGLALMLVSQAIINMLVAVGLGPVTGQTLPLISKGGTSTIITGLYFGMILSVSRYARRKDMTPLRSLAAEPSKAVSDLFTKD